MEVYGNRGGCDDLHMNRKGEVCLGDTPMRLRESWLDFVVWECR